MSTKLSLPLRGVALLVILLFSVSVIAQEQPKVLRNPEVSFAYAQSSRDHVAETSFAPQPMREHAMRLNPFTHRPNFDKDGALQTFTPILNMPATILSFFGQGFSYDGGTTTTGDPPDTNGAVGPNHYVQAVNGGLVVFNKAGTTLLTPKFVNTLWTGYTGTNIGNGCAAHNDGDPVVMYDQLADRWFITQFSLPNTGTDTGPSFQCVAVSKTGDPTGAYWLYDFRYTTAVNDYGKFAVWPDAYYATFNSFGVTTYRGDVLCAYDRTSMLAGLTATQQCFTNGSDFGILPTSVEGKVLPPAGESQLLLSLGDSTHLNTYKFHVDWSNPANSAVVGPTTITVPAYTDLCASLNDNCIAQPAPGNLLEAAGDRLMWRSTYRNFGALESVTVNHSVVANATGGPRWYEIRNPSGTPVLFQSGTYAPNDGKYRWMGSVAQDQAQDMALGFSVSSTTANPSIAWTGRTVADPAGTMGQAETVVHIGNGVETGTSAGQPIHRWGDYSAMTVDPSDDCTFWYTTEDYPANGTFNWDTRISSVKFPNCAANNFTISVGPATGAVVQGATTTYTITTTSSAGTAESILLNIQDLPTGVTGSFLPATVTAGASSTLTLTAAASAPLSAAVTFTVIGKAPSAVHPATATVTVVAPTATPPTNVVATASTSTQVGITWNLVAGATGYDVYRRAAGGTFTLIGSPTTNAFTDSTATANTAYLYRVRSKVGATTSADSTADLATTVIYTDDPLVGSTTIAKAVHLTELRTAVTAVAALAGTATPTFTDPTLTNVAIKSVHVTEIRSSLDTARAALSLPALTYANSAASNTVIRGADFTELRSGMK